MSKVGTGTLSFYSVFDGQDGQDGATLYTWIRYADTPTTGISADPTGKEYVGIAANKNTPTPSNNYGDYQWSHMKGQPGANGTPGSDGQTYYTWIKYADTETGEGLSDDPTGKKYIGIATNKPVATESTNPTDYTWTLFKGEDGQDGQDGAPAKNIWITTNAIVLLRKKDGTTSPEKVSAKSFQRVGGGAAQPFLGRWRWFASSDGAAFFPIGNPGTSDTNESETEIPANATMVRATLYEPGGTTVEVAEANISILEELQSKMTFSPIEPTNPEINEIWIDTSQTPNTMQRWNGTSWVDMTKDMEQIHIGETEPDSPAHNQLWLNTNENPAELLRWDSATNTWSPTFNTTEDIIEAVSQSQQIQSLFNNKADKEQLDTLATVEEVNDKIGQVQQQVGSVVSSIDNRVQPLEDQVGSIETRLEAMPGELALKFASNSAGINLLKNSIGFAISSYYYHDANGGVQQNKDIDFWTYGISELATQAQYGLVISDPDNEGYGSLWSSAPNPAQSAKAYQTVSNLVVGDKYSISALFRKDRATDISLLRIYYRSSAGTMVQIGSTIGLTNISSEWKVATQTFIAPSTQIYVQFEIKSYERGKTAITGLMLNKGDIPYGWTPASDELYATGISFNVNGIKVQTDTNFTQMTAREFAGYAQTETGETERIFSLNGDTTEVANLQAQYEIRMGNIKIRNVNESANKGWSFLGN